MSIIDIPLWALFVATTLLVIGSIEVGYLIGKSARRNSNAEKESPVSAISATVLGLLAFILAFTFGVVANHYDSRKQLVREEAAAVRTAYARSDFLPEPDRTEAKGLFHDYIRILIAAGAAENLDDLPEMIRGAQQIQSQLWNMAVDNTRQGMNSDIAALYIASLNDMANIQTMRIAVTLQSPMPDGFWFVLYLLVIFGMISVGYQTAIAASRRTWSMLILAVSFSVVIVLIAALDDPKSGYLPVSHQPLEDAQTWMNQTET